MPTCDKCGCEIEFRYVDGRCIPFHLNGPCPAMSGNYSNYGTYSSFRLTGVDEIFEFPFITYPSYVNPNAHCPVCGCAVYFYQSPYGGRVFFDELGPPWPKHPCTDNPVVRLHFLSAENRARFLIGAASQPKESDSEVGERNEPTIVRTPTEFTPPPAWALAGWMPFVVTRIVSRPIGIEAEGKLFLSAGSEFVPFRIFQTSTDARYYRTQGELRIGSDLVQNVYRILSLLNECPILLKKDPDLQCLSLSSFILTHDGEVEEITLPVFGSEISQS